MKYLGSRNMVGTNFNINFLRISHEYIPNSPLSFLLQLFPHLLKLLLPSNS